MPRESFYNPTVAEGERPPESRGDMFAVEWAPDGPYSVPGGHGRITAVAVVAGVFLDESGIDRLIRVLRRAKRKIPREVQPGVFNDGSEPNVAGGSN